MSRQRSGRRRFAWCIGLALLGASLLLPSLGCAAAAVVPAPFTPLRIQIEVPSETAPDGATLVQPWGRTYRFERGPLPTRIVSQGVELFAATPRWTVDAGGGAAAPEWSRVKLETVSPREVTFSSSARAGSVQIEATTLIDYDGMIRVDLAIVAAEEGERFSLRAFEYGVPLRAEVARWFNRHVSYDYQKLTIDKEDLLSSVGPFPARERGFAYTPTFFLGTYDVGIEWWSDENLGWRTARGGSPIELRRRGGEALLRVAPVSAPLPARERWRHRFALFPAPMRPMKPDWRSKRFVSPSGARTFEQVGFDYYWIAFPGQIAARYHGHPATDPTPKQIALRERLAKRGVGYIPYGKLMAAPSYHPETLAHADTWPANEQLFTGPTGSEARLMKRHTKWERGDWYSYNICAGRTDFFDWWLGENLKTLREEDTDGIYFDFGSISSICETDPRIPKGSKAEAWHYFELRDFYKHLYEEVAVAKPEALITTHTNGQPRALTAWVDYNFIGEALNALFRDGRSWKEIRKYPALYRSDYFQIPELFFQAQTMPPIGGVTSVLPQVHRSSLEIAEAKLIEYQRGFLAQVLVNDTHLWFANVHNASFNQTIAAIDRFGRLDEAEFEPWWRPKSIDHDSDLRVSVYRRGDALLAVVANWTPRDAEGVLHVRTTMSEGRRFRRWDDIEAETMKPGKIHDDKIWVRVPPHDFKLIRIR